METCHGPEERRANKRAFAAPPCRRAVLRALPDAASRGAQAFSAWNPENAASPQARPAAAWPPHPGRPVAKNKRHGPQEACCRYAFPNAKQPRLGCILLSAPLRLFSAARRGLFARRGQGRFFLSPGRSAATGPHGVARHEPGRAFVFDRWCFALPLQACIPHHVAALRLKAPCKPTAYGCRAHPCSPRAGAKKTSRSSFFDGVARG